MSIHKKRRKCPKTGKSIQSKNYFLKHRFEGDSRPVEISLNTSDLRIAESRAKQYVINEERKRSGLYVSDKQKSDGSKSLQSLAELYIAYLVDKGTQRDHYRKVEQRLRDGLTELDWSMMNSICRREYQDWMASKRTSWSKKTQSHYQTAFKAFFKWLWEERYLNENPLQHVRGIKGVAASTPPPAALTADEARDFLISCPQYRRDFYSFMICVGLRAAEVERLRVESIFIDDENRYWIELNPLESKARRFEILEVPNQMKLTIDRLIKGRKSTEKLLLKGRPTRKTFRNDLQSAGIQKERFDGSTITLHSLRKTFVTMVSEVSDSPAATQRIARHKSAYLTQIIYTDKKALNHHQILEKLPLIVPDQCNTEDQSSCSTTTIDNQEANDAA